jgi:hypothetical protein
VPYNVSVRDVRHIVAIVVMSGIMEVTRALTEFHGTVRTMRRTAGMMVDMDA